jgi:hypothetical protein
MQAVEFNIELSAEPVVAILKETAAQLPEADQARVIILNNDEDV